LFSIMLRELGHFVRHAPATLRLKSKLPQDELYATLMSRADAAGLGDRRRALVSGLAGHVAEIGCGTGAMFVHYRDVDRVTAVEPDPEFIKHAREAAKTATVPIDVIDGVGEAMRLQDHSVDAVVVALVLCSVASVDAVLREIIRIVKPGGEIRLLEHVRSKKPVAGLMMDAVNPLWVKLNGQGCRLNRDPLPALERAGLSIEHVEPFQVWSAGLPAFPMRLIYARAPVDGSST
jgi:SAM-dependent methyltransferase